jgi:predicted TIM-barrel fold metal-dependent hydrolase
MTLPRIISVDDHVIEPASVWQDRLPARYRGAGPRLERTVARVEWVEKGEASVVDDGGPGTREMDVWIYEGRPYPMPRGAAHCGFADEDALKPVTYDEILPGAYIQAERLAAMDENYTDASLSFPSFPRFCGQRFLEAGDKELARLCVEAYNDWMIDEWCAGDGYGRLIPLTIIPLWDAELAAAEIRRCAAKGSHAMCFTEQPVALGLPSIYTGYWDPLWAACQETETVVNMHIGSSSKMPITSPDAPWEVMMTLNAENSIHAFVDWLISGVLHQFPTLRMALSEGQVGWIPFFLARMDDMWEKSDSFDHLKQKLPEPPSHYVPGRVWGCVFNDIVGVRIRDQIGMSQIMFETDFPHADSTYPHSRQVAEKMVQEAGLDEHEAWMLVRGNAIECYGLARWGITA